MLLGSVLGVLVTADHKIAGLADACRVTCQLIEDDRAVEALPVIEPAAQRAPFHATIQEA